MNTGPAWRIVLGGLIALGVGVVGALVFGAAPQQASGQALADPWRAPQGRQPDLAMLDARWEKTPPWPQPPKPVEAPLPAVDAPPAAVPLGIASGRRGQEAIFSVPGSGELRLGVGGRFPDGGRVTRVSRLGVEWVDGAGEHHEHAMFSTYRLQGASAAGVPLNTPEVSRNPDTGSNPRSGSAPQGTQPSRRQQAARDLFRR